MLLHLPQCSMYPLSPVLSRALFLLSDNEHHRANNINGGEVYLSVSLKKHPSILFSLKKERERKKKLPVTPRCIYTRGSIRAAEGCSCVNLTFININRAQRTLCSHKGQSQVPQITEASGANVHMRCLRIQTRQ